ncbi:MAG: serine/threonine protein kinase [Rhodocyclales bacterium CG_4_9_14_3_um_filter_68_10]|nr:MAG: serine/threonine protein kinase [Rhodocyclales bacterium CG_4_9_14_3_um_filter_68_10]
MASQANHPLPCGTRLDVYRIDRQLSVGGFSVVYLASDAEDNPVVIKEYLPASLSVRREGDVLPSVKPEKRAMFTYGMKCFFEEGSALSRLRHPNVVRVLNFFRANDTVYMVMGYERGTTLQDFIRKHKGNISERFIRGAFTRLLNGLREVHTHKLLHLDIKPSNIYLRLDGNPVLLDFGAARQTLASGGKMLKPMYTPGFAAPEQYQSRELLGPWSDIYSIGASMYACLAGAAPQAANLRVERDQVQRAAKRFAGKYSRQLLELIDWCMKLDHLDRPQSVFALQKVLASGAAEPPGADLFASIVRHIRDLRPK